MSKSYLAKITTTLLLTFSFIVLTSCASAPSNNQVSNNNSLVAPVIIFNKTDGFKHLVEVNKLYEREFVDYAMAKYALKNNKTYYGTGSTRSLRDLSRKYNRSIELYKVGSNGKLESSGKVGKTPFLKHLFVIASQKECESSCLKTLESTESRSEHCKTGCTNMRIDSIGYGMKNAKDTIKTYEFVNGEKDEGVDYITVKEY